MKLKRLSIATFNLFNLNEPGLAVYSDRDGWTQAQYDAKIAWTARQIAILKADVFGFQELWHPASLARALDAAGMAADYDLLVPPGTDGTRIVCAAAVKKGLIDAGGGAPRWIVDFPPGFRLRSTGDDPQTPLIDVNIAGFSRPVLNFAIRPRDDEPAMQVYVCHFKSKGPTKVYREDWYRADTALYGKHQKALGQALSTIRRTAEATALRVLLTEQMKANDTGVIVLGDINDGQHSNTANVLTEQPRYLVGESVGGGDIALYTAQTLQEYRDTRDVYYTHVHEDLRESLDHILVSEQLYDNSRRRRWLFDGLVINNDHLNFDDHKADGSNDHGIVAATFRHRPVKNET